MRIKEIIIIIIIIFIIYDSAGKERNNFQQLSKLTEVK